MLSKWEEEWQVIEPQRCEASGCIRGYQRLAFVACVAMSRILRHLCSRGRDGQAKYCHPWAFLDPVNGQKSAKREIFVLALAVETTRRQPSASTHFSNFLFTRQPTGDVNWATRTTPVESAVFRTRLEPEMELTGTLGLPKSRFTAHHSRVCSPTTVHTQHANRQKTDPGYRRQD